MTINAVQQERTILQNPQNLKERDMALINKLRISHQARLAAVTQRLPVPATPRSAVGLAVFAALLTGMATAPAFPQAAVALVKVDLAVVAKGYRMSKLIGSEVRNDKDEKIGTLDDVIADKKQVNFAVLQVGGFLGLGGHLVAVPYESLTIDDSGKKITLPGASKDALKNLSEFKYSPS